LEKVQADLIFANKFGIGDYRGYKFILNTIDVFSRKAYAIPLKTKKNEDIERAFELVFKTLGKPYIVETDYGSEFNNKKLMDYFREKNIRYHVAAFSPHIERFNLTLEKMIVKAMEILQTKNWVKLIPILVNNYNNTYHKSIKTTPNEAFKKRKTYETMRIKKLVPPKFKIGDIVRAAVIRGKLNIDPSSRGYLQRWSDETGMVNHIIRSPNNVYLYDILWSKTGQRGLHFIPEWMLIKVK
jgi:hypothetical protein